MNVNSIGVGEEGAGNGRQPVYLRIQKHFLDRIASGELNVGDQLPTEVEIAEAFGTSRATVQNAMSRLVYEGWIEKQAGHGTFVSDAGHSATIDLHHVRSFEEDVASAGDRVTYRLLNVRRERAEEEVAQRLGTTPGETIFTFERLRFVGGSIIGMERRSFEPRISLDFPLEAFDSYSTHDLVEKYLNREIGRIEVAIRAVCADDDTAGKLEVEAGDPLLLRRHTMYARSGDPILYGEAFYREPFAFRYIAHAERDT